MEKNILAVCDLEEKYALKLMEYLKLHKGVPFEVQAFTLVDKLMDYGVYHHIDILLVSEKVVCDEMKELNVDQIFVLSEEKENVNECGFRCIYKYQATENILREVMCYYAEVETPLHVNRFADKEVEIIGVYSPVKRTLKTSFAITLGQILAKESRVLYINLEEYSGFNSLMKKIYMSDMSDLLYYISQNRKNFIWKLASMVQSIGALDYIPPALSPLDIRRITGKQWVDFLDELRKCDYDIVILDLGESVDSIFDILKECKRVYTPVKDDAVSCAKIEQYEALLRIMECEDIIKKTVKLSFSYLKGIEYGFENMVYGDLGKYVRKVLAGENGYES